MRAERWIMMIYFCMYIVFLRQYVRAPGYSAWANYIRKHPNEINTFKVMLNMRAERWIMIILILHVDHFLHQYVRAPAGALYSSMRDATCAPKGSYS